MKRRTSLIVALVFALFLVVPGVVFTLGMVFDIGISFPCACATNETIVQGEMRAVAAFVKDMKARIGRYPTYEELIEAISRDESLKRLVDGNPENGEYDAEACRLFDFTRKDSLTGNAILYRQRDHGKSYELKGFAVGEFFSRRVVVDVSAQNPGVHFEDR